MAEIDKLLKLEYFERLISDNKSESLFIEQYLRGNGNELKRKFWSEKSSSRLCFDLYSWLCLLPNIYNFQFEKQLPGVKTGINRLSGVPNIDVYYEFGDDIVFIESKYTETDYWKYKEDKTQNGFHLSQAYWEQNHYKSCKLNLCERFYGYAEIADIFSKFCNDIQSSINSHKRDRDRFKWFDPKQETCHLFGIIFHVLNNNIKGKNIHLCNNVWKCIDSNDCFDLKNSIVGDFKEKSEKMIGEIFKKQNCDFQYNVYTVQSILSGKFMGLDFTKASLFAKDRITVKDYILTNYKATKR